MKVLFFPYYPNNPYQPNLVEGLNSFGYEVEGLIDLSPSALFKALKGEKIFHLHWTDPYILSDKLWKSILKSSVFFLFIFLLKLQGRKLIWTIHNFGKHEKTQYKFELLVHRLLAKFCQGIITHNQFAKRKVIEYYRLGNRQDKVQVIPHGNYIGNYPNHLSREEARKSQKLSDDQRAFLFLGQLRQYKEVPELITSFSNIASSKEVLIVAGRPYDQESQLILTELVEQSDHVHFYPGFVPEEMIQQYMKAADVVVFPFKDILTSGSILLAMSFGKAIIVPDIESLEEIIEVGGAITFSPIEDNGLESALRKALTTDLEKFGQRNLSAAKTLSWQAIAEQTADIYANQ